MAPHTAGMLLVVLSVFHAAVAGDPLGAVPFAGRVVVGRLVAAAFWLWLAGAVRPRLERAVGVLRDRP